MRLYLWSFRMGGLPEHLTAPVGEDGRRAVIIANALDDASAHVRPAGAKRERAALVGLGVDAVELDLREYFGQEQRLRRDLARVSLAWLRGGNVFMFRYALRRGGVSRLSGGIGRAANRPNARTIAARGGAPVRPALRMLRAGRVWESVRGSNLRASAHDAGGRASPPGGRTDDASGSRGHPRGSRSRATAADELRRQGA